MFLTPDELAELTGKTRLIRLRTGAVLVVWPDGRALRVERDGSTRGAYSPQERFPRPEATTPLPPR